MADSQIDLVLQGLNDEQKDAVTCVEGPVLIIAGAGTGKTTVIARRIAYLAAQGLAQPNEILALTFTDKAANEMEERVDQLLPFGAFDTTIATFHSFGEKIVRENALELGLPSDFKVLTKPQQVLFFQQNLFRFDLKHYRPLSTPTKFIQAILALISRAKDECITPENYTEFAKQLTATDDTDAQEIEKQLELAQVFSQYEAFKDQAGVLDFGDLINKALQLFQAYPTTLKEYQQKFKYILVDEYQDTNYAQNELVKLLAKKHKNICVVGDDDQSIYRFRGAAISNILQFQETYPNAKQVVLTTNYRSTQPILDAAYKLIRNNDPDRLEAKNNIDKHLISGKSETGFPIQTIFASTISDETDAVVAEIERLTASDEKRMTRDKPNNQPPNSSSLSSLRAEGRQTDKPTLDTPLTYNDIAILVRANSHADPFLRALAAKGIPYKFTGLTGLYDQEEIKELLSFLTVISNFNDNLHLYSLVTSHYYDMPMKDLVRLMDTANKKAKSLFWTFEHIEELAKPLEISDEGVEKAAIIYADIVRYLELSKTSNTGKILYQFLDDTKYLKQLESQETAEAATKINNIAKFFDKVFEFSKLTNHDTVPAFVEYLTVMREAGDDPGTSAVEVEYDGVNVMTVHAAKGLEFKTVFIINAVADRFPSRDRSEQIPLPNALIKETLPEGDFHLQEERRLFYVAVTRSSDLLYITWAQDYGGKRLKKASPFVAEALGIDNLPQVLFTPSTTKKLEQLNLFYSPQPANRLTGQSANQLTFIMESEQLIQVNQAQVEDYLTCPKRYHYANILHIPLARSHLFVYGSAIHAALQTFYRYKQQGKVIPLSEMLTSFENSWVDEGFLSDTHAKDRFNQGKLAIQQFWEREQANPINPTWIEKPFKTVINGNIKLVGRMDRVDITGEETHIIDFKTTENMDEEKATKRAKDSKQLMCYALAYYKLFNKLPTKLSLYFVDSGVMGSVLPTMDTIKKAEDFITQAAEGIRSQNFEAAPDYMACQFCAYSTICPSAVIRS